MSETFINPERDAVRAFKELKLDHPVDMLNLVSLHDQAVYEDGRKATGADAYAAYGRESAPYFEAVGGHIVWSGSPESMVIGPQAEDWDIAFIARYPSGQAFLDMLFNPDYQAVTHHRTAAVKNSRLIRLAIKDVDGTFG